MAVAADADEVFAAGGAAENVLIYDGQNRRRTALAVELARKLQKCGYTVFAFAGQHAEPYRAALPGFFVRTYMPIDAKDVREVADAKALHGKVAVVLHGLLAPGGRPMNALLADEDVAVLAVSCVPAVRGDHRYTQLWTSGSGWRRRGAPKGFVEVTSDEAEPAAPPSWFGGWFTR